MTRWTAAHSAALARSPVVALNFHDVSPATRPDVLRSLHRLAALGESFDPDAPPPSPPRPRVFVAFYDGFRDASLFGAEQCHRLGIRAFFFPIFVEDEPGSATLRDADLAEIGQVHEVGFHTASHQPAAAITPANVEREVVEPVARIAAVTGRRPRIAAWCWGSRYQAGGLGDATLRALGVRHLVSNWSVEPVPAAD